MSLTSKQIDELRAYAKDRKGELAKLISDAADTIEMLSAKLHASQMERSSQYYHGGWIPVSERLPEEEGNYIVTDASGGVRTTEVSFYLMCDDGTAEWEYVDVVAWMPKPEPWKGGEMKTKEEIQKNCIGHVFTTEEFIEHVNSGSFIPSDGTGYFHDGENETFVSVWKCNLNKAKEKYPYVCWYNK